MHYPEINGVTWPVAEAGDFHTLEGDKVFPFFEDEEGDRFYGYGHLPAEDFLTDVRKYLFEVEADWNVDAAKVRHVYGKFTFSDGDRFTWRGIKASTPHAFPVTILEL